MRRGAWLRIAILGLAVAVAFAVSPAAAQQRNQRATPPAQPVPPPPPAPEPPAPPYEPQMLRLAALMGAMSFLEELCQISDGAAWRARMQALIDAEDPHPARRERMAGAFNQSFTGYQDVYRSCTPAARETMERFRKEGAALAAEITNRFGG